MAADPVLEVDRLSVEIATPSGPLHAVRDVSFSVRRGETVCLVGESGCGKSMTSLAIMGLLPRHARRAIGRCFSWKGLGSRPPGSVSGSTRTSSREVYASG